MKHAYEITTYTNLGEGYNEISKWYKSIKTCRKNMLKRLNSNKLIEDLIDNEMYTCYVNVYLVYDELNDNIAVYGPFAKHKVLESIENIRFDMNKFLNSYTENDLQKINTQEENTKIIEQLNNTDRPLDRYLF